MSGFDENPFGDPTIDNPFAVSSVNQNSTTITNVCMIGI